MKKIECHLSDEIDKFVDIVCSQYNWNRAEFNRRAVEEFIEILAAKPSFQEKVKGFLEGK